MGWSYEVMGFWVIGEDSVGALEYVEWDRGIAYLAVMRKHSYKIARDEACHHNSVINLPGFADLSQRERS